MIGLVSFIAWFRLGSIGSGGLPDDWHDLGLKIGPLSSAGPFTFLSKNREGDLLEHYCISDEGKRLYAANGVGVDVHTGSKLSIRLYVREGKGHHVLQRLRWGASPAPPGWEQQDIDQIFAVIGRKVALYAPSFSIGWPPSSWLVASVEGPAVEWEVQDDRKFQNHPLIAQRDEGGFFLTRLEGRILKVKLPHGVSDLTELFGSPRSSSAAVYVNSEGPVDRGLLVISSDRGRPAFKAYPLPSALGGAIFRRLPDSSTVLSNGDVFCPLPRKDVGSAISAMREKDATLVFSSKRKSWKLYDGLVFYGSSHNGRFVAYGWVKEPFIRMAQIRTK